MPFVKELPGRTRRGYTKHAEELEKIVKKPGVPYEFEIETEVPGVVVAGLKTNKFVAELSRQHNGWFTFTSANGKVYGQFNRGKRSPAKPKKPSKKGKK